MGSQAPTWCLLLPLGHPCNLQAEMTARERIILIRVLTSGQQVTTVELACA